MRRASEKAGYALHGVWTDNATQVCCVNLVPVPFFFQASVSLSAKRRELKLAHRASRVGDINGETGARVRPLLLPQSPWVLHAV